MRLYKFTAKALRIALLSSAPCRDGVGEELSVDLQKRGFENPPDSARQRVWWHWLNGNITKEGIRFDLEWMHRIGIGGFQNFDAAIYPYSADSPSLAE